MSKAIEYVGIGSIVAFLMISTIPPPTNATEIIYDKSADLPICVYKEIKDCKTKSGLICEVDTTIDPCQDIFHGFTGTDENYKPETDNFIVPDNNDNRDLTEEERESGFYNDNGNVIQRNRPAINPDFDPDEDCNLEYHLKCIPGSEQDCPEGYYNGEDNVCSPVECQEGYHSVDDDKNTYLSN